MFRALDRRQSEVRLRDEGLTGSVEIWPFSIPLMKPNFYVMLRASFRTLDV